MFCREKNSLLELISSVHRQPIPKKGSCCLNLRIRQQRMFIGFRSQKSMTFDQARWDIMPYARKIVLHCPGGYQPRLDEMVDEFVRDGVVFVGVVGEDCAKIEDIIDELVVGDASDA